MGEVERHRLANVLTVFFFIALADNTDFAKLFENADETKLAVMSGLIEEANDCKAEIVELKDIIRDMKERGAKFTFIAKRERLLIQKRASYTNMMGRICKELCGANEDTFDDLEDYE